ncbi:MAG: hypothetical protein AAFR04_00110 [Pseudomonadota bacterium]
MHDDQGGGPDTPGVGIGAGGVGAGGLGAGGLGAGRLGHNEAPGTPAAQWQTPHLPHTHGPAADANVPDSAKDLDLVEQAFCDGFARCPDPTSFLRMAGIAFEATDADGTRLVLLRVEHQAMSDVGSVTPHLGGGGFRYAPLPQKLASTRSALRFIYFDGDGLRPLAYAQAKALTPVQA